MKQLWSDLRISLMAAMALALILCGVYPLAVWVLGQSLFPARANGSLIVRGDKIVGSVLLSQGFSGAGYFHPRPSMAGRGYDAASSGGSNLGPLSKKLADDVRSRAAAYRAENSLSQGTPVPVDAVTASASGLDPHITLKNAFFQAPRVAGARNLSISAVRRMIIACAESRRLRILGEPRVNVLLLNLALDDLKK